MVLVFCSHAWRGKQDVKTNEAQPRLLGGPPEGRLACGREMAEHRQRLMDDARVALIMPSVAQMAMVEDVRCVSIVVPEESRVGPLGFVLG